MPASQGILVLLRDQFRTNERHFPSDDYNETIVAGGHNGWSSRVSHAGTALLRELAERAGLRASLSEAMDGTRPRGGGHDAGQVLVDLAVMLADGGEAIGDITALIQQPDRHGPVASQSAALQLLAEAVPARFAPADACWPRRGR